MANKRKAPFPGATRKRRNDQQVRDELERAKEEHFIDPVVEEDLGRRGLPPATELTSRRLLRAFAEHEWQPTMQNYCRNYA